MRPARGQLADRRLLRRCDRPLLVLDEPERPFRVLAPALARRIQRPGHELDVGQAGEPADLLVDAEELFLTLLVVEQVQAQGMDLLLRLDPLPHRHPYAVEHPAVDSLGLLVICETL